MSSEELNVAVKPLEWREIDELAGLKHWRADCYIIRGFYDDQFVVSGWVSGANPYKTLAAAKAAAQADYETRIRSALSQPALPGQEAVDEDGRKHGHSKLVYNKVTRTIDKVDPHPLAPEVPGWQREKAEMRKVFEQYHPKPEVHETGGLVERLAEFIHDEANPGYWDDWRNTRGDKEHFRRRARSLLKFISGLPSEAAAEMSRLQQLVADYEAVNTNVALNEYSRAISALTAATEDNKRLREAASLSAMYLKTGFIECPRCGEEVPTENTDAEYTLRAALTFGDPVNE